jgi:AcrR family transcriptional regulator
MDGDRQPAPGSRVNGRRVTAPTGRERILAAAIAVCAERGYQGASTREIAEAAGVTDPLLFYHFGSKADLYLAAVQDQLDKLADGLRAALAGAGSAHERLATFVAVYLRYFLDLEPGLTVTLRELNGLPRHVADAIPAMHRRVVTERLEEILTDGVAAGVFRPLNVAACANAIVGILQRFIRIEARSPGRFTRAEAIAQVLDYYAAGLLPAAPCFPASAPTCHPDTP